MAEWLAGGGLFDITVARSLLCSHLPLVQAIYKHGLFIDFFILKLFARQPSITGTIPNRSILDLLTIIPKFRDSRHDRHKLPRY